MLHANSDRLCSGGFVNNVVLKNAVLWDMTTPCGSCKNRSFGRTYDFNLSLFSLQMENVRSSQTSVLTGVTRRHIADDSTLYNYPRENIKYCQEVPVFSVTEAVTVGLTVFFPRTPFACRYH
jgi:hypothetical protein